MFSAITLFGQCINTVLHEGGERHRINSQVGSKRHAYRIAFSPLYVSANTYLTLLTHRRIVRETHNIFSSVPWKACLNYQDVNEIYVLAGQYTVTRMAPIYIGRRIYQLPQSPNLHDWETTFTTP